MSLGGCVLWRERMIRRGQSKPLPFSPVSSRVVTHSIADGPHRRQRGLNAGRLSGTLLPSGRFLCSHLLSGGALLEQRQTGGYVLVGDAWAGWGV
jgi:hypothetical protein